MLGSVLGSLTHISLLLFSPLSCDGCLYRPGCTCWCSYCSRYWYPYRYRSLLSSRYPYLSPSLLPCRYSFRTPYTSSSYRQGLKLLESGDLDAPLPKKASKNDSVKPQDTTSEDSELFDSSQVEEIKEDMNKKSHSDKRENWIKEKKQGKSTGSTVTDAQGGAEETGNGDVRRELKKSNTNSSAEFFDLE